jgi:hypothetical protein
VERDAEHPVELDEGRCAACEVILTEKEQDSRPMCERCDAKFERKLTLYVEFALACRSPD